MIPDWRACGDDDVGVLGAFGGDFESTKAQQPEWKFAQCFGDKGELNDITEADIISTVEFDHTGDFLATGDKGGRVVLFERQYGKKGCEYKFFNEFQSHEPEFDYLKSLEIEEKINKIKWCKRQGASHLLLSTNGLYLQTTGDQPLIHTDKTIKLWKVYERSLKVVAENNLSDRPLTSLPSFLHPDSLKLPRLAHHDTIVASVPRRIYANAHAYHINSISINSDGETFISADDLRINMWHLNKIDQSFNIVDIKPVNMEELTEVITAAVFHPVHCNYFMYSSSKGTIKLADMRQNALCDQHAKIFQEVQTDPNDKSFFSEIISSVSDVDFVRNGRYILSRDYLTLKIWDIAMEGRGPVQTIDIHDHLRPKLVDLYENDHIFDKFEAKFSGSGDYVMTGSYNNSFMIHPLDTNSTSGLTSTNSRKTPIWLRADKSAFKPKKTGGRNATGSFYSNRGGSPAPSNATSGAAGGRPGSPVSSFSRDFEVEQIDFTKKILHMSWHPEEDSVAIAATNNVSLATSSIVSVLTMQLFLFSTL